MQKRSPNGCRIKRRKNIVRVLCNCTSSGAVFLLRGEKKSNQKLWGGRVHHNIHGRGKIPFSL